MEYIRGSRRPPGRLKGGSLRPPGEVSNTYIYIYTQDIYIYTFRHGSKPPHHLYQSIVARSRRPPLVKLMRPPLVKLMMRVMMMTVIQKLKPLNLEAEAEAGEGGVVPKVQQRRATAGAARRIREVSKQKKTNCHLVARANMGKQSKRNQRRRKRRLMIPVRLKMLCSLMQPNYTPRSFRKCLRPCLLRCSQPNRRHMFLSNGAELYCFAKCVHLGPAKSKFQPVPIWKPPCY